MEKLIVFYARDTLSLTPSLVAAVIAAGGVGGVAGALSAATLAGRTGEIRLVVLAIAAMSAAGSALPLALANLGYGWALVVASLVNRTQRQRIVSRAMLGRVTSVVRVLFLAVDPLGVVIAGPATAALGGDPRPVFLAAGITVVATAAAGWLAGLRRAGHDGGRGNSAGPAR